MKAVARPVSFRATIQVALLIVIGYALCVVFVVGQDEFATSSSSGGDGASNNAGTGGGPSVDAFLEQGDMAMASNNFEEAIGYYKLAVALIEDENNDEYFLEAAVAVYANLGTAYASLDESHEKRLEQAATAYQKALLLYRNEIEDIVDEEAKNSASSVASDAAFFLGQVYQDLHQNKFAVDAYDYASYLNPYHWAAIANAGSVFQDDLADHRAALGAYNQAYGLLTDTEIADYITNPPEEPQSVLSQLQYRIGLCLSHDLSKNNCALEDDPEHPVDCKEMATHAFALALEYDPDNQSAKHMLASITADATMKRASNEYVKSLFDDYAQNFENSLVKDLKYTGYQKLRLGFDKAFGEQGPVPTFDVVVDAGCGTGLVGEQFRNVAKKLIGVDLSEAILQQAVEKRPGLYDEVVAGDVTEIFRDRKPISLIIAGDSYIYFGDLDPLFESMRDGLAEDGYVAFTLENVSAENEDALASTKPDWRWQLTASGRFAHRKDYVLSVGKKFNLDLVYYEPLDGFRFEHGVGVRGHIFVMQKRKPEEQEL